MRCFCGAFDLKVEDTTYVKDGRPMCHPITCERVGKRLEAAARNATTYDDLGNTVHGRDPGDECDRVADPYSKSRDDGSLVHVAERRKKS